MRYFLVFAYAALALAADLAPELLNAAKKGETRHIRALLDRRAPIEAKDKDGRTPLMLAAQHGHTTTVELLRERGADPQARDRQGWTAYGLALTSSAASRVDVLKLLPPPPRRPVALEAELSTENLYSSCSMPPAELAKFTAGMRPQAMVREAVEKVAASPGIAVGLVPVDFGATGSEVTATLRVRPQVSCVQQESADNLSLAIDVRVSMGGREAPLLQKTFGGGLKGLHARRATSPAQYSTLFADWAKEHAAEIYWSIVSAILKGGR